MLRKRFLALTLLLLVLFVGRAWPAEPLAPVSQWLPQDAVLVLEISHPKAILDLALNEKLMAAVSALPNYEKLVSQQGVQQFFNGVKLLAGQMGVDWQTGVRKLVGGGVTMAVLPRNTIVLTIDAEDGEMLAKVHEIVTQFARAQAEKRGNPDQIKSREIGDVTGWSFTKNEAHFIVGNRLVVSNRGDALLALLNRRSEGGESLAGLAGYQAAKKAVGDDAAGMAFVNLEPLKQFPPVQRALAGGENPLGVLLASGVLEAARQSDWAAAKLRLDGTTLSLEAIFDAKTGDASETTKFACPGPDQGVLPRLSVPRLIADGSFWRDLGGFYAAKDKLFPQRTGGLIFFENMMGIFFSGLDLADEVLAEAKPEIRFVVAQQQYGQGAPQIQYPAFAAVFRVKNPAKFGEILEAAWQKAIGLVNVTSGQKAMPGLIISQPSHNGVQFSMARPPVVGGKEKKSLDPRANFQPCLARFGDYAILSSTEGLTKDLIDAVKKEQAQPPKPVAGLNTLVELDGTQLSSILAANRDNFIRQNMLGKGLSEEAAAAQTDLALAAVKPLGHVKLQLGSQAGTVRAGLELKLNLP
jgi:hypothetical protein